VVVRQNADIADTLHLRDVAMATMFWLSTTGCTFVRLSRAYVAAIWPYVKLLRPLVVI